VFETGLFLGLCDTLVVGTKEGVVQVETNVRRNVGCG
jgi:ribose 5-phosphate isomerase A